jgi:cobalt ECF transporter T component CbiQ
MEGLYEAMERTLYSERSAAEGGLLQRVDPRVKVAGLAALIVSVALARHLPVIAAVLVTATVLAMLSSIPIRTMAARIWVPAFVFTAAIAIPALFLTPGAIAWSVPVLRWNVTWQGLRSASYLVLRVESAATLALLLVLTTPWTHVLKALRVFRVPVVFVVVLGMTCRYIVLLLETAHEMFESRKSRTVGELGSGEQRKMAVSSAGVLLSKSFQLSGEVYYAMLSRGFRGEVYVLDEFEMRSSDWIALAAFAALTALAVWAGR